MSSMWTFHTARASAAADRNGDFSQAMQMANVDGEAEEGMIDLLAQFGVAVHRVDEHAGFRLEGQGHSTGFGVAA